SPARTIRGEAIAFRCAWRRVDWGLEQQFGAAFTPEMKEAWIKLYDDVQREMMRAGGISEDAGVDQRLVRIASPSIETSAPSPSHISCFAPCGCINSNDTTIREEKVQMRLVRTFAVVAMVVVSTAASAWNSRGHMMVAAVAWEQLEEGTQSRVVELLKLNPNYKDWIRGVAKADQDKTAFM